MDRKPGILSNAPPSYRGLLDLADPLVQSMLRRTPHQMAMETPPEENAGWLGLPSVLQQFARSEAAARAAPDFMSKARALMESPMMGMDAGGGFAAPVVKAFKGAYPYDPKTGPSYAFRKDEHGRSQWVQVENIGAEPKLIDRWEGQNQKLVGGPHAGFFSDSPDVANRFAQGISTESAVFPVSINFKKPLVIDAKGKHAAAFQFDSIARERGTEREMLRIRSVFSDPNSPYDGLILKNTADEGTVYIPRADAQITPRFGNK